MPFSFSEFFTLPYKELSKHVAETHSDKLLPYMLLSKVAEYGNMRLESPEMSRETTKIQKEVAAFYHKELGVRHILTLNALSEVAIMEFLECKYAEVEESFSQIGRWQREVLGDDNKDVYFSLQYEALALFHQTKFRESEKMQQKAAEGLRRTLGANAKDYLKAVLFRGWALEWLQEFEEALACYDEILERLVAFIGADNPLSMMCISSRAIILLKQGHFAEAKTLFQELLAARKKIFGDASLTTVDTMLHLALLYRDMDRKDEALAVLDLASQPGIADQWYYRVCQVNHIRAQILLSQGQSDEALRLLSDLFKDDPINNRELLWVRLTLAGLLRARGKSDEALLLFAGILKVVKEEADSDSELEASISDEPETPISLTCRRRRFVHGEDGTCAISEGLLAVTKVRLEGRG